MGGVMKKLAILLFLVIFLCVLVYAQDYEMMLDGSVRDIDRLPRQNRQSAEFTFVRLIYNGRITGYLKNWYTDYPQGDNALVIMLARLTSLQVAPEPRAIPIIH